MTEEQLKDLGIIKNIYGNNFLYEFVKGVRPNLRELKKGQKVVASSINGHYILMTEINIL